MEPSSEGINFQNNIDFFLSADETGRLRNGIKRIIASE